MATSSIPSVTQLQQLILLPGVVLVALGSIVGTLTTLLASSNHYTDMMMRPNPVPQDPPQVYDFVVVGSGSAGGIIASRLSENGFYKILLLEAGGDPLPLNQIPFLYDLNLHKPETDWGFKTVPQKFAALGLTNNTVLYPRGKSVGGSSNLNGMIYMRGCPKDFDNWAQITGDSQWNYENVLPYFKKSQRYEGIFKQDLVHHGRQGPIYVTFPTNQRLLQEWLEAGQEMGYPFKDLNARQTASFSPMEYTLGEGIRWETYEGYIKPALKRTNFKLIRYAHVVKINLNERNEAVGVTYVRNGQTITVKASKEVILSAGAIGSPQLLLLSGIGPAQELISLGIKPIVDLPGVGKGLLDHALTPVGPFLYNESVSLIPERDLTYNDGLNYLVNKQGPIASIPYSGIAAISTTGDSTWPNIVAYQSTIGITASTAPGFQQLFGIKNGSTEKYLGGLGVQDANWIFITLGLPKSSGEIKLASNNPFDAPLIDPNYYSDPDGSDLKAMVQAYTFFVDLHENTQAYKKYNTTLLRRPFPGCEQFYGVREKDFTCRVQQWTATTYHPSCTCRMGKPNDPKAVVDSNLRVRGVRKLRIADASVMPQITNANINAPTMMIAEKAADFILQDYCTPQTSRDSEIENVSIFPWKFLSKGKQIYRVEQDFIPCPFKPH